MADDDLLYGSDESFGNTDTYAKPTSTRVILEVDPLLDLMERNTLCKLCSGPIKVDVKTTCLASKVKLFCLDKKTCGHIDYMSGPAAADIPHPVFEADDRKRSTDFAVNVLYVLAFLSCGDGGKEAGKLLGLLGLPNDTTMESRSFGIIEDRIGYVIRELKDEILLENLTEEARQTISVSDTPFNNHDFDMWQQAVVEKSRAVDLPDSNYPQLTVSYDMGWQQKGSGGNYNSASGHGIMVGSLTRKPLSVAVLLSKLCAVCDTLINKGLQGPVRDHYCVKNHFGSSGAMEPAAALMLTVEMFDKLKTKIIKIIADDDASTRSTLSWSNIDYMANTGAAEPPQVHITRGPNKGKMQPRPAGHGRLPARMPEPMFGADPNHRKKLFTGELRNIAKRLVGERCTMTMMDVTCLGKNFGYMIRALPKTPKKDHKSAAKAVLEHHFDSHGDCGPWCKRKLLSPAELVESTRYYRCKKKDAKLYALLQPVVERFIGLEALAELDHGMDTQVNESLNNTLSWMAPKNKVYCSSGSLQNRISIAIGIASIGFMAYYKRLLNKMGIVMTPDILHFLRIVDGYRSERLANMKTTKAKKKRIQRKMERLQEQTKIAKKERARRDGTYKSGRNMAEGSSCGFTAAELEASNKKAKRDMSQVVCQHCGGIGHSRTTSKKCGKYKPRQGESKLNEDADEADAYDAMKLDDDSDAGMEFFDAGTWSDDENEGHTSAIL